VTRISAWPQHKADTRHPYYGSYQVLPHHIQQTREYNHHSCLCIHPSVALRQIRKHASPYHFVARRRSRNHPVVRFTQVLWSQAGFERLSYALPLVADSGHHQVKHKQPMGESKSKSQGHRYFNSLYNDYMERLQAG
jgi:hypothetical protein